MKTNRYIFIPLLLLAGCQGENTREFTWDEDIAQLTNKDLGQWLRKAPFTNELRQSDDKAIVATNAEQVFPFMGRYYNAIGEIEKLFDQSVEQVFEEQSVLYQDEQWGDLFLTATLLYDNEEVYLDNFYSESGNLLFDGMDAPLQTHSASLTETAVIAKKTDYKTGLYWAHTQGKSYLLGFYQQKNLVFEAAIPLLETDTIATLDALKAVNEKLALQIPEWQQATVSQLQPQDTDDSFWVDPFTGIYLETNYMLHRVRLKTKDTPFEEVTDAPKGDHYFSYNTPNGEAFLYTTMQPTDLLKRDFEKAHESWEHYKTSTQSVFVKEQPAGNRITGTALAYTNQDKFLEITFEYPKTDTAAKEHIHGILKHIRVSRL